MKSEFYEKILETELKYTKCFSVAFEKRNIIEFKDDRISDMYTHNFIFLKELMDKNHLIDFIEKNLDEARKENRHFHIMLHDDISHYDLGSIFPQIDSTEYCFMAIEPKNFNKLKIKEDCSVLKADTSKILNDGRIVDIEANKAGMGESFATKRIGRKIEVYEGNSNLNFYVCYKGNKPIGKCELFIKDGIGKIEDFDILEEYQKQGYGTSVLHKLLEECYLANVDRAYLITDNSDTAKDMYKKCGFSMVGIETSLLFTEESF